MLVAIPTAFLMLLTILQVGLWAHAQHRAQAVAGEALAAGRAFDATAEAGGERGRALADDLGGDILQDVSVHVARRDGTVRSTVEGTTLGLVPGWRPEVSVTMVGPIERVEGSEP